jgi:hypothetical protein
MKGRIALLSRGLPTLICVLSLSLSCCSNTGYENVRLIKEKKTLSFYPDRNGHREPMILNMRTSFAAMKGKWGVLFSVPYRETGFGAINRTLFTTVLYALVVDHNLNQVSKPLVLYNGEGNITRDFFETGDGFGVAYLTKENHLICRVFGDQEPLKIIKKYRVPAGSKVIATDRSFSDLALSYYNDKIFLLVKDGGLKVIKAEGEDTATDLMIGKDIPDNFYINSGDLFVDQRGIHALWVETPRNRETARRSSFFYAFSPHTGNTFVIKKVRVHGDNSNELKAKFLNTGPRLYMLFQYGNLVWEGEVSRRQGNPLSVKKLIILGKRNYPPSTIFSCTPENCYVFLHKRDGAYFYSKKCGLKKSPFIQYRRAVKCGEKGCIQETSNKGISLFDPEL